MVALIFQMHSTVWCRNIVVVFEFHLNCSLVNMASADNFSLDSFVSLLYNIAYDQVLFEFNLNTSHFVCTIDTSASALQTHACGQGCSERGLLLLLCDP